MRDNISPEERLLRLIRQGRRKSPKKANRKIPGLTFHRILLVMFLVLSIYLLLDFFITTPDRIEERVLMLKESKGGKLEVPEEAIAVEFQPVTHYIQPVKSRELFTAAVPKTEKAPSPTFMEMISQFRLQGIVSGANPQAIIEDTRTKQVYFLSPGERIGEIELKQILPGKVKLNYYGQEAELSL